MAQKFACEIYRDVEEAPEESGRFGCIYRLIIIMQHGSAAYAGMVVVGVKGIQLT